VGRLAEAADRRLQARGRYVTEVHVLGEMDKTIACDISGTRDVLGYQPRVALEEGMRRSVRWCRDRGIDVAPRRDAR
jgi:nucleoside-diphosphate-sugar epimerase